MLNFFMRCLAQFVLERETPVLFARSASVQNIAFPQKALFRSALLGIVLPFASAIILCEKSSAPEKKKPPKIRTFLRGLWLCLVGLLKFPFYLPCMVVCGLIAGAYDLCCLLIKQPHPLLDRIFFVVIQLFRLLFFWVDVLVESVCSPCYTIWCLIVPVIYQTNSPSTILSPLAKGLILVVYGLGTLLVGGVVLSLVGVIPTMGLMPTALTVASGTLVQLVGQPCASFLLILMGLHTCAALAYLMRNALSRGLLIKWACQLHRHHTNTLGCVNKLNDML